MEYSYTVSGALPPPDMSNDTRRAVSRLGIGLFVYGVSAAVIVFIVGAALTLVMGDAAYAELSESVYYIWGVQVLSMYVIALPIFFLITRGLPSQKGESSGMSLGEFTAVFLISEAVMTVGSLISSYIVAIISALLGKEVTDATSELVMKTPVWIVIIIAVLIGPLVEELIFRRGLIPVLRIYGDRFAIIVSAIAFGIFHGNFSQLVYATGLGLILGYVYVRTGGMKHCVALHVLLNFFGTVPTLMLGDSVNILTDLTDETLLPEGEALSKFMLDAIKIMDVALLQYGLMIGGIIMLFYAVRHRLIKIPDGAQIPISGERLVSASLKNAGAILFIIFCLVQMILSIFM